MLPHSGLATLIRSCTLHGQLIQTFQTNVC